MTKILESLRLTSAHVPDLPSVAIAQNWWPQCLSGVNLGVVPCPLGSLPSQTGCAEAMTHKIPESLQLTSTHVFDLSGVAIAPNWWPQCPPDINLGVDLRHAFSLGLFAKKDGLRRGNDDLKLAAHLHACL